MFPQEKGLKTFIRKMYVSGSSWSGDVCKVLDNGVEVLVTNHCPADEVYGLPDPKLVGTMPITCDLERSPSTDENNKDFILISEQIGIIVNGPVVVARLDLKSK